MKTLVWFWLVQVRGKDGKLRKNKGAQIPVPVPAILDNRTWEMAQIRIKDNRGKSRPNKYDYLLSQRVTCGCCNYKVVGTSSTARKDGSKPLYYRCPSKATFDCNRPCELPCFSVDKVDTAVWNWIKGLFENEELLEAAIRRYLERGEEEIAPLKRASGRNQRSH